MLPVVYAMTVSLDGFVAGSDGDISWSPPDAEVFASHLERNRQVRAQVLGRRLYDEMLVWESAEQTMSGEAQLEFARIWRAIPKVVFSRTLDAVEGNARLATADLSTEIGRLRDQPGEGIVAIGGADLAATAIAADLIDEFRMFVCPVTLGGGTPYFPSAADALDLQLVESHTFASGVVHLRYRRT